MTCELIDPMTAALFTGSITAAALVFAGSNPLIKSEIEFIKHSWNELENERKAIKDEAILNKNKAEEMFEEICVRVQNRLIKYKEENNQEGIEEISKYSLKLSEYREKVKRFSDEIVDYCDKKEKSQLKKLEMRYLTSTKVYYFIILLFLCASLTTLNFWVFCSDLLLRISQTLFLGGVIIFLGKISDQLINLFSSSKNINKELDDIDTFSKEKVNSIRSFHDEMQKKSTELLEFAK